MNDYRSQSKYRMNSFKIGRNHIVITDSTANDKSTHARRKRISDYRRLVDRAERYKKSIGGK